MLNIFKWFSRKTVPADRHDADKRSKHPRRTNIDFDYLVNTKTDRRVVADRRSSDSDPTQ